MFMARRRRLLPAVFLISVLAFILFLRESSSHVSNGLYETPIVSLASSHHRLDHELPVAIRSLTRQTATPKEIRIYMPNSDKQLVRSRYSRSTPDVKPLSSWLLHPLVKFHFVEDVGPATKFIHVLRDLIDQYERGDSHALSQPVIIVDDDHAYSPRLVSTLMSAHEKAWSISVGFRGWRIRQDLKWGVLLNELDRHVQHGYRLAEPYRVGVLTANEGYLVTPRMFLPPISSTTSSPISALAPILDTSRMMSSDAHLVDDIWMAGSLATQGVSRYVIPLPGPPSLDITITHTLEDHMASNGTDREKANTGALRMFKDAFSRENIWYRFEKDVKGAKGVFSPPSTDAEKEPVWIGVLARLWKEVGKSIERAKLKFGHSD